MANEAKPGMAILTVLTKQMCENKLISHASFSGRIVSFKSSDSLVCFGKVELGVE